MRTFRVVMTNITQDRVPHPPARMSLRKEPPVSHRPPCGSLHRSRRLGVALLIAPLLGLTGFAGSTAAAAAPAAAAAAAPGDQSATRPGAGIPGAYVVTLRDGAEPRGVAARYAARPRHVYVSALNGFAATLSDGQVRRLEADPDVVAVEADQVVTAGVTQAVAVGGGLHGLDRIDQRPLPLSGGYSYTRNGTGVRAYVIDTGIATAHVEFGTRAQAVFDAFGGNGQDCNGHGTHVAGTIGGTTYGVAKDSLLRGVRVLDCAGSGATSGIIAGVDWVKANHIKPAVANMSLGGGKSTALNTAATNLAGAGVFLAVAAGNENQPACDVSPASAPGVLTTAASDQTDTRASLSNYGGCVDLYATGVAVTSAWLNGGTNTISGTSMASPHVAGVAALYKAYGDASSSTVNSWIVSNTTANVIKSNVAGTVNQLLFKSTL